MDQSFLWRVRIEPLIKALLIGVGIIFLLVGVTAVISPPNVWDAMEYHLPRITMWMSNRGVDFFSTPDYAQLIWGPWAEYAMMHMHLLWGGDRFVNLVEFFSLLGSVIGVSLIAKMLGDPLTQDGVVSFIADLEIEAASLLYLCQQGGFHHEPRHPSAVDWKSYLLRRLIALVSGGLLHLNIARTLFLAVNLSKRNLFEVSVVCFLICIASELRAHALPGNELSTAVKKAA